MLGNEGEEEEEENVQIDRLILTNVQLLPPHLSTTRPLRARTFRLLPRAKSLTGPWPCVHLLLSQPPA